MARTTDRVRNAAGSAKPYVERALTDEEFRESLRAAFAAAKQIYDELMPPKGVSGIASRVAQDDDIQQSVRRAVAELRHAADRLQEGQERDSHGTRNVLLLLIGIAIGIFFNPFTGPEARSWVKRRVSGGEFSYDGRTTETVTG
jgi:hypothetical protein